MALEDIYHHTAGYIGEVVGAKSLFSDSESAGTTSHTVRLCT